MLRDVFATCARKVEPGGRIAVNVANLGRKPYRSLSADVIGILQDDLGLLLRGEVIWQKGDGAAGNCAWGSYRSAANPVLRDLTERVVIASKGRFDRARPPKQRAAAGHPHENTLTSDEFMTATLDVWHIDAERANRVNHPAPFPVQLPERLIHLYTYKDDVVLDPFMGSGSTLVAARRTGRRGIGYDTDAGYVETARQRVAETRADTPIPTDSVPAVAQRVIEDAGFRITRHNAKIRGTGVTVLFVAADTNGRPWYFDVVGTFTTTRSGLQRSDAVWKCIGRAHVIRDRIDGPLVLLTSHLPHKGSEGYTALQAAGASDTFYDIIELLDDEDALKRLASHALSGS